MNPLRVQQHSVFSNPATLAEGESTTKSAWMTRCLSAYFTTEHRTAEQWTFYRLSTISCLSYRRTL